CLVAVRPAGVDENVLTFDVAELAEALTQRSQRVRLSRDPRAVTEPPDPIDLRPRRLRLCSERRGKEAASKSADELPPLHHCITSSVRCSKDWGTVSPSALAV